MITSLENIEPHVDDFFKKTEFIISNRPNLKRSVDGKLFGSYDNFGTAFKIYNFRTNKIFQKLVA